MTLTFSQAVRKKAFHLRVQIAQPCKIVLNTA